MRCLPLVILAAVLIAGFAWFLRSEGGGQPTAGYQLTIRSETGTLLWHVPVSLGERVTLRYIHSVARRPVEETFLVEDNHLLLVETVFDSFGAGLPTEPDPGARMYLDEETHTLHIIGMARSFPVIRQRVGSIAAHQLMVRDQMVPLASLAEAGALVNIQVER